MSVIGSAHGHASLAFNATFYATVAVIIPVLYLALVVQGGGVDALLKEALADFKQVYANISVVRQMLMKRISPPWSTTAERVVAAALIPFLALVGVAFAVAMTIAVFLIAIAGGVSELCALYVLYKQDALIIIPRDVLGSNPVTVNVSYIVLLGTGILIVATTVLPFVQLISRVRAGKSEVLTGSPTEAKSSPDKAD